MKVLTCDIKIGNLRTTAVNNVVIRRSIYSLGDTAVVKLPVTAILRQDGQPPVRVETAEKIAVGNKVEISLGYDGRNRLEFRGWVKAVNLKTPVEIVCEDEFYTTRSRNLKTSGTIKLRELLGKCGLDVAECEELTLRNFAVPDKPVSSVLAKLTSDYGLAIFFDLEGRVYACRPERVVGEKVKYELRRNVINDDNLQYQSRQDLKIEIRAICIAKDGSKIEARKSTENGSEKGIVRTKYFYDVTDVDQLASFAARELERETSGRYAGNITTFLEPVAAPTMVAQITDPVYADRSGSYYIEAVETSFGREGGRRKVEIGGLTNEQ